MRLNRFKVLWQDKSAHGEGEIEPSERRFRTWVLAIAALVGPPLVFLFYYRMMFNGLFIPDALDYAQVGRNLTNGNGFVTYVIRPLGLMESGVPVHNALRQPDMIHGPLYPLFLALAFGLAGPKDAVVAWVSGLFYLLTIPLVYRLATKVFGRSVAMITVLVFMFNALLLEYAYSGLPLTLEIFLSTWLLLVMYNLASYVRDHEGSRSRSLPKGQLILAGVLMGLLYLTDTIFLWFFPVAAAWLFWLFGAVGSSKQRLAAVVRFAVPFVILALPWMIRYMRLGVNPFFGLRISEIWMNTKAYPDYSAYRLMPGELIPSVGLFKAVVTKILLGIGQIIQGFPQISASWLLAFFLPSLLFRFTDPAVNNLRKIMMLLFLSLMVGMLLFGIQMPLFVTTIPTMLAFAVAYLLYLIRQAQMRWQTLSMTAVLLAIAVVFPLPYAMFLANKPKDVNHEATAAKGLAKITRKQDTVFSDVPQVVAWHANRPAIYIPQNDIRIKDLRKRFDQARWLFLSDNIVTFGEEWRPIYIGVARWNEEYMAKLRAGAVLPAPPGILHVSADENVFLNALEGFVSVPPAKGGKRVVIMASSGPAETPQAQPQPNAQGSTGESQPTQSADTRTP